MEYQSISVGSTVRDANEDHYVAKKIDDYYVFSVADGVGGLAFGDVASGLAVEPFSNLTDDICLEALFDHANKQILNESEKRNRLMGSTLVSAVVNTKTNEISIANVGDSRAYIFTRDGMWHTKDDTLVQELVDMGIMTEEQAFDHPNKNRLNKALGTCESLSLENHTTLLPNHSMLLLSTDGLHDYVRDEDIKTIVMTESPKIAAEKLVKKARDNGSTDDITIVLVSNQ